MEKDNVRRVKVTQLQPWVVFDRMAPHQKVSLGYTLRRQDGGPVGL